MNQETFQPFMDFTMKLLKSTEIITFGTTSLILLTTFLLLLSFKVKYTVYMEDYHLKELQ